MSLRSGQLILLARRGTVDLAVVVSRPEHGVFRAFTLDGKTSRFPETLPRFGPIGTMSVSENPVEMKRTLTERDATLRATAAALDVEVLRAITLDEVRPYSLEELSGLLYEEAATPERLGALLVALFDPENGFDVTEKGFTPVSDDVLAEREREREAAHQRAIERHERQRREKLQKRLRADTLVPELKLLVTGRADPARLSPVTLDWLRDLRERVTRRDASRNGDGAYGEGLIRIQDENHAVQLLARAGLWDPDVEDLVAIRTALGSPIPDDVVAEAGALRPRDVHAEDRTDLPTFTIDSASTQDLDDAISIRRVDDGFRVDVHIADVERWVRPGTALDRWGAETAESLYLPERICHLFPRALVERVSLDPGVDRHAFSLGVLVRDCGDVTDLRFARTRVRSDERVDYETADERFGSDPTWRSWLPLIEVLQRRRESRGARVTLLPDLEIKPGPDGIQTRVVITDTPAHRLISELMVFFNEQVGLAFRNADVPAIFKTQPEGSPDTEFPDREDPLYFSKIVRLLRPSVTGLEPGRHTFMGVDAYCQATSPIRRYADLVHQRQLAALLAGEPPPYTRDALTLLYPQLDTRASEVRQVERRRRRYWVLRRLSQLRGTRIEGIVSQIRPGGRPAVFFPQLLSEFGLIMPEDFPVEIGDEIYVTPRRVDPIRGGVWAAPSG